MASSSFIPNSSTYTVVRSAMGPGLVPLSHPPADAPAYFSVPTISGLLRRKGFDVSHLSHPGNSRSLRAALYFITVLQMKRPRIYELFQDFRVFDLHLTVNLFDIMYIIAKRRP